MKEYRTVDILKRIDVCLAERGISKEKFYSESGVSSASYSQWNKGVHEPTTKKLKQIADYLNVSMQYLLTGEEQKEKPPAQGGEPSGLPEKYYKLSEEGRRIIDQMIDFYLDKQEKE